MDNICIQIRLRDLDVPLFKFKPPNAASGMCKGLPFQQTE